MNRLFCLKNIRPLVFNVFYSKSSQIAPKSFILNPKPLTVQANRFFAKKYGSNKNDNVNDKNHEDDENYEDVDEDEDDDDSFIKTIDTSQFRPGFKIVQKHVPSLRLDSLLAGGLNLSRKKIDDNFYSSKLRLNGEKVLKKSHPVKEGDRIDMICEIDEKTGKRLLKRVYLYKLLNEPSKKNKPKVVLINWKGGLFEEDAYKDIYIH